MRRLWRWTLEEADTDTSLWQWRMRSTWNRQDSRLCRRTTHATTHIAWGVPKNKRSELKRSEKSSAVSKIHRRGRSLEKSDRHGVGTSIPIPTGGSTYRFFTGVRANHDAAYICQLQAIDEIDLEENSVKMMGPYDPAEPLARLIQQLEKGREFARAGGQTISDAMMMSKGITLLAQTRLFNDDIRDWRRQSTDLKTWAKYIYISHWAHREQKRAVTTAGKGGCTVTVQNTYGAPPLSP